MKTKKPAPPTSPLVPPLRTLLHTIRCIAQHEDALCTLLHNLQNSAEDNPKLQAELRALLEDLPAEDYLHDLNEVASSIPGK